MLMRSTVRRALTPIVVCSTSAIILLSGSPTASAITGGPPEPVTSAVETTGPVIKVTVSGTGYTGGSQGSAGGGTASVTVPATCWMTQGWTGKEYYDYVASGREARTNKGTGSSAPLRTGYTDYKNDVKGHWYGPMCTQLSGQSDADFFAIAELFFALHTDPVYFPAGQAPPTPPVPPELLRDIATKQLTPPKPQLDWNPRREGTNGTLVNLETWFWLDNRPPTTLTVNAAAGGNTATVTVTFDGMEITAPGEEPLSCADTGTPYTPGAHSPSCALPFSRASIASGSATTHVTVKTRWTGTWSASGADPRPVTPLPNQPDPVSGFADIQVDEVQTLVTGAR
jgi:hypothetical protein